MTQQNILQLALDALILYSAKHRKTYGLDGAWDDEISKGEQAIGALRLLIDKPAAIESDAPAGSGGWKAYAKDLEIDREYYRGRANMMSMHQRGECWYWQGDGNDHVDSMTNSLPVVIRADVLYDLINKKETCSTCNGNRVIAGHAQDGSFDGEDCPDCNMPEQTVIPLNWSIYNSGAEVASGLLFEEAWDYMTPERLARGWCAVCVVNQENMPRPIKTEAEIEDPCPGCQKGGVCRTPACGRLKLPMDHPFRTGKGN